MRQYEVVSKILGFFENEDHAAIKKRIFDENWLDIELIYEQFGWKVKYDKPGWDEDYDPFFEFSKKKEKE